MKVLILSIARSGSGYLTEITSYHMHKKRLYLSEPFNGLNMNEYDSNYVSDIIAQCERSTNVVLKTHLNQLYRLESKYYNYFLNKDKWYIIYNLRKDLFSCIMSHTIAETINNFGNLEYNDMQITVDEKLFEIWYRNKLNLWQDFSLLLQNIGCNKIVYFEDLTFDNLQDIKLLGIKHYSRKSEEITEKTPYHKITIINLLQLKELFDNLIKNYQYPGIINNNGFLELK